MTTVLVPFFRYVPKIEFSSPVLFFFFFLIFVWFEFISWDDAISVHHVTVPIPAWTFPKR